MSERFDKDLFGNPVNPSANASILHGRFLLPPFSVLNTRDGAWQERKRGWLSLGLQGEVGRDAKAYSCNDGAKKKYDYLPDIKTGVSIFDPVLCEINYTWFAPKRGMIFDPFAGGSVRGIVATELGYEYTGIDLREEQIAANIDQGNTICKDHKPLWLHGDSNKMNDLLPDGFEADFIFSCPPYGNLEKYSDLPEDISNMDYKEFKIAYATIILRACQRLKPNSFASFVVANFRDKNGFYNDLMGDTVAIFQHAGLMFYNEAVLLNAIGSLPIRVTQQFNAGRKLGKAHQNILIFVKGDPKKATEKIIKE